MNHELKKNLTYLLILQNVNYIIPLLLLPYLTRTLGVDNFGKITFAQAFITYFILLTDFGFNISSTQEIVRVRDDKNALSKIFWSTTITKALFALASFLIFSICLLTIPKLQNISLLLLISFTGVISTILFPVWLFQGLEKMSYITWFNVVPRILVLIFTFLLVKQQSDYVIALMIQSAGTFLSALSCSILIYTQKLVKYYPTNLKNIKSTIVEGWHIFASGVATNFYTTTNTVILGIFASDTAVGLFSASEKIIRAVISLFSSVSQVTFPRINAYYQESEELALIFGAKVLKYLMTSTLIIGLLIFAFSPLIVKILFGVPQYNETITILRISSFIPFFSIFNGILATNVLVTFGLKRNLLRIVGFGGIFSLVFIVPSVILFQARGVAIIATLTEILITIIILNVFKKHHIHIKF